MKKMYLRRFILLLGVLPLVTQAMKPEVQLSGRKNLVLSSESRQTVLRVGNAHLAGSEGAFLAEVGELKDPFSFEEPVVVVANTDAGDAEPEVVESIVPKVIYDDASVLAKVSQSFSKKVRGSIARGETSFLQVEGGTLLKPGTSFPVRIPQAEHLTFTLTVSEITSDGYTLKLGKAVKKLSYDDTNNSNAGSIKFSNQ